MKFKVGDIITGTEDAGRDYAYTTDEAIMEVISIKENTKEIRVKIIDVKHDGRHCSYIKEHIGEYFWVDQKYFKKIRSEDPSSYLLIKRVIFSGNKTIVLWQDGTKTIVTCANDDTYDKYAGLAMATMKKYLGNNTNSYHEYFARFIDEN